MSDLISKCSGCGICVKMCPILKELGVPSGFDPGMPAVVAFGCCLCGRCEAVCPSGLSPMRYFAEMRREAVRRGDIDINAYRFLFPHRPNNLNTVLRAHAGIDYSDLSASSPLAFMPGCSLLNYSPAIVRAAHSFLEKHFGSCTLLNMCCGLPADLLGLEEAGAELDKIVAKLREQGITKLVTACPNCYYYMETALREAGIQLEPIYNLLLEKGVATEGGGTVTVHDACPDRFRGKFADSVRALLEKSNFTVTETADNRRTSLCCGSGGMLPYFRDDLSREWISMCHEQQKATGAQQAVTYCLSCALKLDGGNPLGERPVHILELILKSGNDCYSTRTRLKTLVSSEDGAVIWDEVMADE